MNNDLSNERSIRDFYVMKELKSAARDIRHIAESLTISECMYFGITPDELIDIEQRVRFLSEKINRRRKIDSSLSVT